MREVEQRLRVADRLAACMIDPRAVDQITHSLADVIRFRLLMISAGYEDGNDANRRRAAIRCSRWRSIFAHRSGSCARSRQYRGWRILPDVRAVLRMGRAMVDLYCESFKPRFPNGSRWTSTTTFDAFHAWSTGALFERPL